MEIKSEKDIKYKTFHQPNLQLNVRLDKYTLPGKAYAKAPAVVYMHGGAFQYGDKENILRSPWFMIIESLLERGCICFSINYRFVDKKAHTTIQDCITDCKDAIRFINKQVQEHSSGWEIDTARLGVWGTSAGAYLALMLLLTADNQFPGDAGLAMYSSAVKCAVDWFGPTDFTKMNKMNNLEEEIFSEEMQQLYFGNLAKNNPEIYDTLSPVSYLSGKSGPVLVLHGDKDSAVHVNQSRSFYHTGVQKGMTIEYQEIKNAEHRFIPKGGKMSCSLGEISQKTIDFLCAHL